MAVRPLELSADWYAAGQRQKVAWVSGAVLIASLLGAALVVTYETYTPVYLLCAVLAAAVIWRPRIGIYFAFVWVLLFEEGGADQLMIPGKYFLSGLSATFPDADSLIFSPLEVLLVVTTLSWLGRAAVARSWRALDFRPGTLFWPMLAFSVFVVTGFVHGATDGGDLNIALWEVRSLAYLGIVYVLAANLIRTPRHVATLLALGTGASVLIALEFVYRRLEYVSTNLIGVARELAYWHESSALLAAMLALVVAQVALGGRLLPRLIALAYAPFIAVGMLAAERRAGFIALVVAGLTVALILFITHRKAFFLLAVPLMVAGALYLPLYWNSSGIWSQPARAVKSLIEPDARDAASNEYRVRENMNIRATIDSSPLLGVGFGREFHFVVPMPNLSWWPFWRYEPHNNVMWVWLKTGIFGFIAFWYLMGSALTRATQSFRFQREPTLRALALVSLAALVISLTFSWVDLGLIVARLTVFLGTLLGALGVIDRLATAERPEAAA